MNQSSGAVALLFAALLSVSCAAWAADKARNLAVKTNNAVSEQRIALVIGNSAYTSSPLKNPVNDAKDIASKLRRLGFDVVERHNLQTRQIGGTLREFRSKLVPGAVALVFYAGHGLQIKGDNYLPAVDADINSEEDVPNQSLAVRQIMDVLDESKTRLNLVFLDACRNNPYARSFRSADRGLARVSAPSGTLISYATRPGSVAADGGGRNGLYTSKLLKQMDSSLQIELALKRVVGEVKAASQGRQEPWMEGSIEGDFCFAGCVANYDTYPTSQMDALTNARTKDEVENETWNVAVGVNSLGAYETYLSAYPLGRYATHARLKISALKKADATTSKPEAYITPVTMQVAEPGQIFRDCEDCPEMVVIPAGKFEMSGLGMDNSVHRVTISHAFAIGKTEVTQGQWKAIMGNNPSKFADCGADCPVENVNWDDIEEFVEKLNAKTGKRYRLPTEAEWEYACRAGGQHEYCGSNDVRSVAWYGAFPNPRLPGGNSGKTTHPVATKQSNAFGLYDMSGNVWEWVEDNHHYYYAGTPTDGSAWKGDSEKRIHRGGSWGDNSLVTRAGWRSGDGPYRYDDGGFRLVRTLP